MPERSRDRAIGIDAGRGPDGGRIRTSESLDCDGGRPPNHLNDDTAYGRTDAWLSPPRWTLAGIGCLVCVPVRMDRIGAGRRRVNAERRARRARTVGIRQRTSRPAKL